MNSYGYKDLNSYGYKDLSHNSLLREHASNRLQSSQKKRYKSFLVRGVLQFLPAYFFQRQGKIVKECCRIARYFNEAFGKKRRLKPIGARIFVPNWRRGWDSNPRLSRVTGFQDQLLKPLGHLSVCQIILSYPTINVKQYLVALQKCFNALPRLFRHNRAVK